MYGIEKFWAFLAYSGKRPPIMAKLRQYLELFPSIEDYRNHRSDTPEQLKEFMAQNLKRNQTANHGKREVVAAH